MTEKKITLSKKDRKKVAIRHQYLQGSWNYERMQNGGWAYSMIPAIKKLYPDEEERKLFNVTWNFTIHILMYQHQ